MGGTTGTDLRLVQRIPLAPGAEHEKDGIHCFAIIDAGPMAPQRVWFTRWEQRLDPFPQRVRDAPIPAGFLFVVMHQRGS
jgi:hypothetical protein